MVGFSHRKILNSNKIDKEWSSLQRTVSKEVAYKATEVIAEYSAEDMLDFAGLNKSNVDRIFIKHRDGLPMASGMRKILPKADVIYLNTKRKGDYNNNVEITPLDEETILEIENDENSLTWFADPINARGTTTMNVLRYLREFIPFNVLLLSHVAANKIGIGNVQTQITNFNVDSYMNYAFLSKKINPTNGFLEDGLELIPDFGDKVFGTIGDDYPIFQMQDDLRRLLGTKVGDIEIIKGIIIFLLQRRESDYYSDKKVKWATRAWIKWSIKWYLKLRDIRIDVNIEQHFNFIMDDLVERGFINYKKYSFKDSYTRHYYVTDDGVNLSAKTYLPILDDLGILKIILKDFDHLVNISADTIKKKVNIEPNGSRNA